MQKSVPKKSRSQLESIVVFWLLMNPPDDATTKFGFAAFEGGVIFHETASSSNFF